MIVEAISLLVAGKDLDSMTMSAVMDEIMNGEATDAQKSAFLTALAIKGETIEEITTAAKTMRQHSERFPFEGDVLEIVGTGGDKSNSINISTITSIIVSSLGINVAKHGNRAASSKCGTADCLEALGVNLMVEAEKSAEILKEENMCFLFAQKYHPAMRFVGGVRREIGIRTMFNILGPLANPAGANLQLFGVYTEEIVEPLSRVLSNLGVKRGMTVYGQDVMDEISLSAPTTVCEIKDGNFESYVIKPEDFGFKRCEKSDLVGGSPAENAAIARDILSGRLEGPKKDVCLLNAGAAIHIAKPEYSIQEGIELAKEAIASGKAIAQLNAFVAATNR